MAAKRAVAANPPAQPSFTPVPGAGSFTPDEPPGWAPPPPAARRARVVEEDPPRTPWLPHVLLGLVAPWVVLGLFLLGHERLDSGAPDVDGARSAFTLAVVAALVSLGAAVFVASRRETRLGVAFWVSSVVSAVPVAIFFFIFSWDAYEDAWALGIVFVSGLAVVLTIGLAGTGGLLVGLHKVRAGGGLALANAVVIAGAAGFVAMMFLGDLEGQAAEARAQHAEPAWNVVVSAAVLVAVAWRARRRGRRTQPR